MNSDDPGPAANGGPGELDHRDLDHRGGGEPRQSVVKQPGRSRRAKLTQAPGTDPDPHPPVLREDGGVVPPVPGAPGTRGPNDDRLRQDRPPHW